MATNLDDRIAEILAGMTPEESKRMAADVASAANARGVQLTEDAMIAAAVGAFDSGNFGPEGIANALDQHLAASPYMTTTHMQAPAVDDDVYDEPEYEDDEPEYVDHGPDEDEPPDWSTMSDSDQARTMADRARDLSGDDAGELEVPWDLQAGRPDWDAMSSGDQVKYMAARAGGAEIELEFDATD
jgi:hypothetical protein